MWRAKRRSRRESRSLALNVVPMLDVMFNLLIFFLITASFRSPEALLGARVPRSVGVSAQASLPLVPIRIYLEPSTHDGAMVIRVSSAVLADATSLSIVDGFQQLFGHLSRMKNQPGVTDQTPVIIAARNQAEWDQVVGAYNAAVRAQFKQVVFAEWK
jgi:biopolymer transport protein ExbD